MRLYDDEIRNWRSMCDRGIELPIGQDSVWPDAGSHQMILRGDMAYELGGSTPSIYALGGTALTENTEFVPNDEIRLIGPDMNAISADTSYARLTIALVNSLRTDNKDALYNSVKRIENVRYHVHPEGFMPRVSSVYSRESIRVSKDAIAKGISFAHVGNLMLNLLHKNPDLKAAAVIFITDPSFDFAALEASVKKTAGITAAIDHIFKNVMTDCKTCSLQKVCDEVEGLREMHFGKKSE